MAPSIFEAGQHDPAMEQELDLTEMQVTEVETARLEVEQTRSNIGGTLDAIREKLDPPTLMEQAKATVLDTAEQLADKARGTVQDLTGQATHAVHDATIGRAQDAIGGAVYSARQTGETLMDSVRENPIPVALIGVGIGWLLMNSRRGARTRWTRDYNYVLPYQDRMSGSAYPPAGYQHGYGAGSGYAAGYAGGQTENPVSERLGDLRDRAGDVAGQVQERVGTVAGQVQERVGTVAGQVQDRAGQLAGTVQDRAGQLAGQVQDRAGQIASQAGERVQWAQDSLQRNMQENPVAVGVVAMGLGALLGLLLPTTEPENRYLGETRDRLVEQGQQTAQQVAQKVSSVAQEGLNAAKEAVQQESREQGLAA